MLLYVSKTLPTDKHHPPSVKFTRIQAHATEIPSVQALQVPADIETKLQDQEFQE